MADKDYKNKDKYNNWCIGSLFSMIGSLLCIVFCFVSILDPKALIELFLYISILLSLLAGFCLFFMLKQINFKEMFK